VGHVYTDRVRVRHHELDPLGRVTPATHLRWLAQVAIDASADAGFDAAWYARAGAHWLVRRTTFAVHREVGAGDRLAISTWVEDFRRVRSLRRYESRTEAGAAVLDAATDWVFVDVASGRPRRVPHEIEAGLAARAGAPAPPRRAWSAPPPPVAPGCTSYAVRWADLDALGHVNNAAYLDLCQQGTLDVLGAHGWPLARLVAEGGVPAVAAGDLEYLDAALPGDVLEVRTWFTPAADALTAHHHLVRAADRRLIVQANVAWRWPATAGAPPAPLAEALHPLRAA